jgi:hypothetical protein
MSISRMLTSSNPSNASRSARQGQPQAHHQGKEHDRQEVAVGGSLHRVARHDLHQQIDRALLLHGGGRSRRGRGRGALQGALPQARPQLRRQALAGTDKVDQGYPQEHGDGRDHDGVGESLEADPAQGARIAHAGDAQHQGREDQRDDQHEEQAQEDLPDGEGDVLDEARETRGVAEGEVGEDASHDADGAADQDLGVER